jgi:hypothetical protein
MPNSSRETIYETLFQTLNAAISPMGFKTASRRAKTWSEVPVESQPCFFQQQTGEVVIVGGRGMPAKYELSVDEIIYVNQGSDPDLIISTFLNNAVDAISAVLQPVGATYTTLGLAGVSQVVISGQIEYMEGTLGPQAAVVVPVKIVCV